MSVYKARVLRDTLYSDCVLPDWPDFLHAQFIIKAQTFGRSKASRTGPYMHSTFVNPCRLAMADILLAQIVFGRLLPKWWVNQVSGERVISGNASSRSHASWPTEQIPIFNVTCLPFLISHMACTFSTIKSNDPETSPGSDIYPTSIGHKT